MAGIDIASNFSLGAALPIDDKLNLSKAQMLTINENIWPNKYFTICTDDGKLYIYNKANPVNPVTGRFREIEGGSGQTIQVTELPTATAALAGTILEFVGETDADYTNGYFYQCVESIQDPGTYEWVQKDVQPSSEGATTEDVTANITVGGITSGDTILAGTTLTDVLKKLTIIEIAPTTTFTASGSGVKEEGTSVTPTLTLKINNPGSGTPVSISFYSVSTLLDTQDYVSGTNTYTYTMETAITTNTTVKGVLNYKKSDNTDANIEKTASYTFVMASYYGAVSIAPTTAEEIKALTKNVKTSKGYTATYNLSNQRSCYCYPASFGNLTSIKDANNFEYIQSYTKTNVTVDGTSYNVYTLTDPTTITSFKQVFA